MAEARPDQKALYPWLLEPWQMLQRSVASDRLAHGLLLRGRAGVGKGRFAQLLAQSLLCESPADDGLPCSRCRSCNLFVAGSHPDFLVAQPEETGKALPIDSIREVSQFFALTSHYGRHKVAIITPAEAMQRGAANALLKTLEEPPAGAVLLLVSHVANRLPVTVRSRCQSIVLDLLDRTQAVDWLCGQGGADRAQAEAVLSVSNGAPLPALAMLEEGEQPPITTLIEQLAELAEGATPPMVVGSRLSRLTPAQLVSGCRQVLEFTIYRQSGAPPHELSLTGSVVDNRLIKLADRLDLGAAFKLYELVVEYQNTLVGATGIRAQDIIDSLLIAWARASGKTAQAKL
ncbi:MAG: DNA polymerase III subunit delta' [Gammaproteobacteria bacterium]|nr:DNA polymerase III subunit delta' [Gammaproteobacteria bacterium]